MGCKCSSDSKEKKVSTLSFDYIDILSFIFGTIMTVILIPVMWVILVIAVYQGTIGSGFDINKIIKSFSKKKNKSETPEEDLDFDGLEVMTNNNIK